MKTAAVIAEFNPFHNGHARLLREVRARSGADAVIVVMSGDFVQRGAPAILDKYERTRMALDGGANLVLELPCAAATGSAGEFAAGAAALLERAGIVDSLWFGSECGRIEPFLILAEQLAQEPEAYRAALRAGLGAGLSYPLARMRAAVETLAQESNCDRGHAADKAARGLRAETVQQMLSMPNNILGLEYCIALRRLNSRIEPHTVPRAGTEHHARTADGMYASAGAIRAMLQETSEPVADAGDDLREKLAQLMPEPAAVCLADAAAQKLLVEPDDFSDALFYRLALETRDSLQRFHGVSPELAGRILAHADATHTLTTLAESVKAKHLTRTAVDRALFRILLGIETADVRAALTPACLRVLGVRNGGALLTALSGRAKIPFYLRASKLPEALCRRDLFASRLYERMRAKRAGEPILHECGRFLLK